MVNCDYILGVKLSYNSINLKNEPYNFKSYKIWTKLDKNKFSPIAGMGQSERVISGKIEKQVGYELGVSKKFGRGFQFTIKGTYWSSFWQSQTDLQWSYRRFNTSLTTNNIGNYFELNLKTNFEIWY